MVTCLSGGLLNLKVLLIDTIAACFYAHTAGTVKVCKTSICVYMCVCLRVCLSI